jgi:glucosamine kinase
VAERQRTTPHHEGNEAAAVPAATRVLGLDIGGTASRARLCVGSRIVAESRAASASLPAAGLDGARVALTSLLADLPLDAAEPLDAVCAGSAGLSVPGAREFLTEALAPLARLGRVVIVSDAMLVLPAAGVDAGVAVICGTGSVAVGTAGGRSVQAGGWGYLLGDEGSGYWIVREALRELLGRRDRSAPLGVLGEQLVPATGAADLGELHRRYLEQPHRPRHWAKYAELVLTCPDPGAADIRARAAGAVAALAASAMTQLAFLPGPAAPARADPGTDPSGGLPVVLGGGLFASEAFARAARDALRDRLPHSAVSVLTDEPVAGAVRLAARAAVSA